MTSIRDVFGQAVGIGETVDLVLFEENGRLLAEHPSEVSPVDVIVVEGEDRLEECPPTDPVPVEILDRIVDGRIAGRIVDGRIAGRIVDGRIVGDR